jgi:uncharacterized OB-fold protein
VARRAGKLAFQRDGAGRALFPPRAVDPATGAEGPARALSAGLGRVHPVTLVHGRDAPPFALAPVDLDEGFRRMARVDAHDPAAVAIGDRLRVAFRPPAEGEPPLPVFLPEEPSAGAPRAAAASPLRARPTPTRAACRTRPRRWA